MAFGKFELGGHRQIPLSDSHGLTYDLRARGAGESIKLGA